MRPSKKTLITVLVIGIVLLISLLVAVFLKYRQYSANPEELVEAIPDGADITIGEIRHTAVKDGRKEWSLEAVSANYSGSTNEALFEEVRVTFFMEDGREVWIKGHQGKLNTESNDIELSGDVVVRESDYQLAAESLSYDHAQRVITVPVPVTITGGEFVLQADEMAIDLNTETALLRGAVKGIFSGNEPSLL